MKTSITGYRTLIVTFAEPIRNLDEMFDDRERWGASSLKEWIDSYESTRFTQTDDRIAVITSEYNMNHVLKWLESNTPIACAVSSDPQE